MILRVYVHICHICTYIFITKYFTQHYLVIIMAHLRVTQLATCTHSHTHTRKSVRYVIEIMKENYTCSILFPCTGRAYRYFSWPNTPCRMLHEPTTNSYVWIGNSVAKEFQKNERIWRKHETVCDIKQLLGFKRYNNNSREACLIHLLKSSLIEGSLFSANYLHNLIETFPTVIE